MLVNEIIIKLFVFHKAHHKINRERTSKKIFAMFKTETWLKSRL